MQNIELQWTGFRGFKTKTEFTMPRLTILIGRNNVGKSSAYAPLLLLRQTLEARDPRTALLSRGPLVDVGPYSDYVTDHDETRKVSFELSLDGAVPTSRDAARLPTRIELGFQTANGTDAFVSRQRVENATGDALISRNRKNADSAFNFNSPLLPTAEASGRPYREITAVRKAFREEQPRGFIFDSSGGLFLPQIIREDQQRWAAVREWYNAAFDLYDVQTSANRALTNFLRSISYLGPLRSLPQRTYRLGAEPPSEVGLTGENAPELLFRHVDDESAEQVNIWLGRLGYGRIEFDSLGNEYFQAQLVREDSKVNLADTGVGLSQVIPLLVQGTLAHRSSMIISQQPEIHLNPAQQSIVADFLIERAMNDVRILVETHSEHVLLRIRRRIAEGTLDASDVAIYYVEASNGGTSLRPVPVGDQGEIRRSDWPQGFFEDQLGEAFALAAAQSVGKLSHANN